MKYKLYTRVLDGGQAVARVIIDCEKDINAQHLSNDLFEINVTRRYQGKVVDTSRRLVTSVFAAKELAGSPQQEGRFIHVVLLTGKDTKGAATLMNDKETMKTVKLDLEYSIHLKKDLIFTDGEVIHHPCEMTFDGYIHHHVDVFEKYESSKGILYREYSPRFDGNKKPLIIWLHGMGEGGKDNELPIIANRGGTAFVLKENQRIFGGAYIVAPQCPTFWMPIDYLGETYHDNYTKALLSLIDEVCLFHPDIDEDRIYIGGCSMGGYQTIKTVLAAPHRFAAAFPICAAYELSMKDAWKIKDVPMWFVHCMSDNVVPSSNSVKNYERLIRAGGQAEVTLYPDIRSHGEAYFAHAAWIPALNNDPVSRDGIHLFEWLAEKTRKKNSLAQKKGWLVPTVATTSMVAATLYYYYRKSKQR